MLLKGRGEGVLWEARIYKRNAKHWFKKCLFQMVLVNEENSSSWLFFTVELIEHVRLSWFLVLQLVVLPLFALLSSASPACREGYRQGTNMLTMARARRVSIGRKIHFQSGNNNDGIATYVFSLIVLMFNMVETSFSYGITHYIFYWAL